VCDWVVQAHIYDSKTSVQYEYGDMSNFENYRTIHDLELV